MSFINSPDFNSKLFTCLLNFRVLYIYRLHNFLLLLTCLLTGLYGWILKEELNKLFGNILILINVAVFALSLPTMVVPDFIYWYGLANFSVFFFFLREFSTYIYQSIGSE